MYEELIFCIPEVTVQLNPTVVREYGTSSSSSASSPLCYSTMYQESEILKNILDSFTSIIPSEVVGCLFEYEVKAEQSPCSFVNILCTFSTKSELDKFETLYHNGQLAQRLEHYLKPKILGLDSGLGNEEFKLEICILRKTNNLHKPTSMAESNKKR